MTTLRLPAGAALSPEQKNQALIVAAMKGKLATFSELLRARADVNCKNGLVSVSG